MSTSNNGSVDNNLVDSNTTDNNLPEHPQASQPQTEGERQHQLQNAHLENQDAKVKLPNQHSDSEPKHKQIGSVD